MMFEYGYFNIYQTDRQETKCMDREELQSCSMRSQQYKGYDNIHNEPEKEGQKTKLQKFILQERSTLWSNLRYITQDWSAILEMLSFRSRPKRVTASPGVTHHEFKSQSGRITFTDNDHEMIFLSILPFSWFMKNSCQLPAKYMPSVLGIA